MTARSSSAANTKANWANPARQAGVRFDHPREERFRVPMRDRVSRRSDHPCVGSDKTVSGPLVKARVEAGKSTAVLVRHPTQRLECILESFSRLPSRSSVSPISLRYGSGDGIQKLPDREGMNAAPRHSLAELGLARSYAIQGGSAKASTAYKHFLPVGAGSDSDISILRQAKIESSDLN
jgi:hypothetical protein